MSFLTWCCPTCHQTEHTGLDTLLARLQAAGLLKRASREERQDVAYLVALGTSVADRWSCPACGAAGVSVSQDDERDGDFDGGRPCAACGELIPAERLELFPETTLCTACQSTVERGGAPDTQEYCPRCGVPMQIQAARGAGITRYALLCPQCRR